MYRITQQGLRCGLSLVAKADFGLSTFGQSVTHLHVHFHAFATTLTNQGWQVLQFPHIWILKCMLQVTGSGWEAGVVGDQKWAVSDWRDNWNHICALRTDWGSCGFELNNCWSLLVQQMTVETSLTLHLCVWVPVTLTTAPFCFYSIQFECPHNSN